MKPRILIIIVFLIMICNIFIVSAEVKQNKNIYEPFEENETIEIRVAIYDDRLYINNLKESCGGKFLVPPLKDYKWKVGNKLYFFSLKVLSTKDIIKGELTVDNYDILLYSWDQADTFLGYTGFSNLPRNRIRVKQVKKFIEDGGGYYGSCGGALIAGGMRNKPKTFFERAMKKSCLGISCFDINYRQPSIFSGILPGVPLTSSVYGYLSNPGAGSPSGIFVDCNISKDNPFFDDMFGKTRRITWCAGSAFLYPEHPDREIMVLAKFPEVEFSDNNKTKIHNWRYIGGISGLIKAFITPHDETYWNDDLGRLIDTYVFAEDWVNTGQVIETNVANKSFLTAEIYPNSNQARIVRCSGHPEFKVHWGGHIEDVEDDDTNNHYEGFYRWVNITPDSETIEDEVTYNYCIFRRFIAWPSKKVPDNDLPPIYGPSQVSDIYPYNQSSEFTIAGNAEVSGGIESLDLFYRYSSTNGTVEDPWCNWTIYSTDFDVSDGWSWEFNSTKTEGPGYYQFYSIRHVRINEYEWLNETAPPGPDAIVKIFG